MTDIGFTPAKATPARGHQLLRDAAAAYARGDHLGAVQIAKAGIEEGVEHLDFLMLLADYYQQQGDQRLALNYLSRAAVQQPNNAEIRFAIGYCLAGIGEDAEAMGAFDDAIMLQPGHAPAHFHKGRVLEKNGQHDDAARHYETAAGLDPKHVDAHARRAWLAAQQGDLEAAGSWADKALKLDPSSVPAQIARMEGDLQQGRFADVEEHARELSREERISGVNRGYVLSLLGDALDGQGRSDEAFGAYESGNGELRNHYAPYIIRLDQPTPTDGADRIARVFSAERPGDWMAPGAPTGGPPVHAFLVGFPRSGTTLMERMFAQRDDTRTIPEKDTLFAAIQQFIVTFDGPSLLRDISAADAAQWAQTYWQAVADYGVPRDRPVLIDKMPLYSTALPLVAKLFPRAKVIIARRDPRDVVLSCFRRRFQINPSMYEFLDLHRTASFYDAVMRATEAYLNALPLDAHIVRYEDVVADLEGETAKLTSFLGIAPDPAMARFAENRNSVATQAPRKWPGACTARASDSGAAIRISWRL